MHQKYINNQNIYISPNAKKYNPHTWSENLYQLDVVQFFYDQIVNNNLINIVDIGAQSGAFSLMAKFLPNTIWHSFEPDPFNYELCLENIKYNHINNINLYSDAISNRIGEDVLNVCSSHRGLNTLGKNLKRFGENENKKVSRNNAITRSGRERGEVVVTTTGVVGVGS